MHAKKLLLISLLSFNALAQEGQICHSLYQCSARGNAEGVQYFLEGDADPNKPNLETGKTPLVVAVENGHRAAAWFLLEAKADPNASTPVDSVTYHLFGQAVKYATGGWPVLAVAVQNGDANMAHILLEAGADPNRKSASGQTVLSVALERGDRELARLLLSNGALREKLDWIDWPQSWLVLLP